jgi:hypothetical protein
VTPRPPTAGTWSAGRCPRELLPLWSGHAGAWRAGVSGLRGLWHSPRCRPLPVRRQRPKRTPLRNRLPPLQRSWRDLPSALARLNGRGSQPPSSVQRLAAVCVPPTPLTGDFMGMSILHWKWRLAGAAARAERGRTPARAMALRAACWRALTVWHRSSRWAGGGPGPEDYPDLAAALKGRGNTPLCPCDSCGRVRSA